MTLTLGPIFEEKLVSFVIEVDVELKLEVVETANTKGRTKDTVEGTLVSENNTGSCSTGPAWCLLVLLLERKFTHNLRENSPWGGIVIIH
jgi:hypothetical protein